MTDCWAIIAERNARKWIVDNGFLSYEEADHFRLQWQQQRAASNDQRYPAITYFVARYNVISRVFHIVSPGRFPGGGTGDSTASVSSTIKSVFRVPAVATGNSTSKKRCAKCGTQYEGIGCPRCYPRVAPTAGTPTRPTRWLRNL